MREFKTVAEMVAALQGMALGEKFMLGTVLHEVVPNSPGWPEKNCIRPIDPDYERRAKEHAEQEAEDRRRVLANEGAPDEVHCSCVPHLRARLALLEAVADAARALQFDLQPDCFRPVNKRPDGSCCSVCTLRDALSSVPQ